MSKDTPTDIQAISDKLVERLKSIPVEDWLDLEYRFNRWEFPMMFYDLMPVWWLDEETPLGTKHDTIRAVCDIIQKEYPLKKQLHYLNVYKGCMTEDEFDAFWNRKGEEHFFERRIYIRNIHYWEDDVFAKIKKALEQ